jgi:hypothetical protein
VTEEDRADRSFVEHILWCRAERETLAKELEQYHDGSLCIGEPGVGGSMTQGTRTHIMYLEKTIAELSRVIAAYSPPPDA